MTAHKRSLRTRITLLTICAIMAAVAVVTLVSVVFIRTSETQETDQMLLLLCETGERNLDYYFDSVQRSVGKVSSYAEENLDGLEEKQLERHVKDVEQFFENMAYKTNGVLTYYYRIDPEVSKNVKGFWYTNMNGEGFVPHEVTDITEYDTSDTSKLVWFTVPKSTGKPIWLPPYITENLGAHVISYNVPIYWHGRFVGVIGIEIDYSTMAGQVESIHLFENGYAFINDEKGNLFFHPRIDVATLTPETTPEVPEGLISDSTFVQYNFDGVDRRAAWLALSNGMRLTVSVPISETEGGWQVLVCEIILVSIIVVIIMSIITRIEARRITMPLEKLTRAAETLDQGSYNFVLDYEGDDEVGRLTESFKKLAGHVKEYVSDLNKRVYVDELTSVKNKGAFAVAVEMLQVEIDENEVPPEFAVGVFDCDNLKVVNDSYGHDKGDEYLQNSCSLICHVFQHSPVYRTGGDEFAVILQNEDFIHRNELIHEFERTRDELCATAENRWEQTQIAMGVAVYDPVEDAYALDTVRRADKAMYANKHIRKMAMNEKGRS